MMFIENQAGNALVNIEHITQLFVSDNQICAGMDSAILTLGKYGSADDAERAFFLLQISMKRGKEIVHMPVIGNTEQERGEAE